ncbi:MAG: (2Fe-2S)-binding protein [Salinibacterium sp.]|nr:(2Fe-2S)-binding protein [Salinibacterium sp.]
MSSGRVPGHGLERGAGLRMRIDGQDVDAYEGESIAAAVMAAGGLELRETDHHDPRGYFCGMGVCFDCVMIVDGVPNTRTCVTFVRDGMTVEHQIGASSADAPTGSAGH